MFWNTKFMLYLGELHRPVHAKMQQVCMENKLKLGKTKL